MSYMLVRLSGCLNHIKETIIIIIIKLNCKMQYARHVGPPADEMQD